MNLFDQFTLAYLPDAIGALAVLLLGWLAALALSKIVRSALKRFRLVEHLMKISGEEASRHEATERFIEKGVYYIAFLFVLTAFFQTIGLTLLADPLNQFMSQLFLYAPRLIGAAVLLFLAWIIANILRMIVIRALKTIKADERWGEHPGVGGAAAQSLSKIAGDIVYWAVFLLFLPAVLSTLQMEGLLRPVESMITKILEFLPNLFGAAIILGLGFFAARAGQRIVSSLLSSMGLDGISEQLGLPAVIGNQKLSGLAGLLVNVLIFIPVLIASLNALNLDAIVRPASDMLSTIMTALPALFAAGLLLLLSFVVGRITAKLAANFLTAAGFDTVLNRLGISREVHGERTPSLIAGQLLFIAVMLFAAIEAANLLNFTILASLLTSLTVLLAQVGIGLVVFAIGLHLANTAYTVIRESGTQQADLLAKTAKAAILILTVTLSLQQMGLSGATINLAFGLFFGAIALGAAVAVAIAFGYGGREVAARQIEEWHQAYRNEK
ncbi:MAG: mechanosensitive ion channel [bacterium]|jgi:hypothetical protein